MPDPDHDPMATDDPAVDEPAPQRPTGRQMLWRALTGRPSRTQVIAAVLLGLLGYAAAVQIQLTHTSDDFAGQGRGDLVELLDSLSGAADRTQQQISDLQDSKDKLESSSGGQQAATSALQKRLDDLEILAGTVATSGPGITVTIQDPQASVTAASLLNGLEELRDAGAEAIQINTSSRIVASSYVGGSPGALSIDGRPITAPYVIRAIGAAHTLSEAVAFPGGLADEISSLGGTVTVQENDRVDIDALHAATPSQYARSTGQ
jgi:uncharacterized protein YlxW (UPF0749 family)